ncbi:MAG TPA: hypothetical protein VEG30_16500 [Terriglobales bacterium]|nr:hypothetical protein [Terriglobales bacterium]
MGVSRHLRMKLGEYDSRIRTFIPNYEVGSTQQQANAVEAAPRPPTLAKTS